MMCPLTLFGYRFVANLAVLILLLGNPVCACAESSDQSQGEGMCHTQEPATSGCPPAQHDPDCPHCIQPEVKTERAAQEFPAPWTLELLPTASVFITTQDGAQPLTHGCGLSSFFSSRSLLSLICTLQI